MFESNLFFLALHLLLLNYLVSLLENVWTRGQFATLVIFSAFWTSLLRLFTKAALAQALEYSFTPAEESVMTVSYCSINHLVFIILMGCR